MLNNLPGRFRERPARPASGSRCAVRPRRVDGPASGSADGSPRLRSSSAAARPGPGVAPDLIPARAPAAALFRDPGIPPASLLPLFARLGSPNWAYVFASPREHAQFLACGELSGFLVPAGQVTRQRKTTGRCLRPVTIVAGRNPITSRNRENAGVIHENRVVTCGLNGCAPAVKPLTTSQIEHLLPLNAVC